MINIQLKQEPIKLLPRSARMARASPSAASLPSVWTADMDRFICHCEALGDVDIATIIRGVKKKYSAELDDVILEEEAIEKRIACLELCENDYFREGMRIAVARVEAAGFKLPSLDDDGHDALQGKEGPVGFHFSAKGRCKEVSSLLIQVIRATTHLLKPETTRSGTIARSI